MGIKKFILQDGYLIYYLNELDDEIKALIRNRLVSTCEGIKLSEGIYSDQESYKDIVYELLSRLKKKSKRKGLIGEFLTHIIICDVLSIFQINSPYFNMEEKGYRKGFDILLNKKGETDIWIAEVKSGNNNSKSVDSKYRSLINIARSDINKKLLSREGQVWTNAINSATHAMRENDHKNAILTILKDYKRQAKNKKFDSTNINAIFSGVVYNQSKKDIKKSTVEDKYTKEDKNKIFKEIFLIAIDSKIYDEIYNFIEDEAKS